MVSSYAYVPTLRRGIGLHYFEIVGSKTRGSRVVCRRIFPNVLEITYSSDTTVFLQVCIGSIARTCAKKYLGT